VKNITTSMTTRKPVHTVKTLLFECSFYNLKVKMDRLR
jgi:hypothetical protein